MNNWHYVVIVLLIVIALVGGMLVSEQKDDELTDYELNEEFDFYLLTVIQREKYEDGWLYAFEEIEEENTFIFSSQLFSIDEKILCAKHENGTLYLIDFK